MPTGWEIGQYVPGKIIDSSMAIPGNHVKRASQWDIWAASRWIDSTYTVVLRRVMYTGFLDDLDMSVEDSLKTLIGISNNVEFKLDQGSTSQGFTPEFWLILPR